MPKPNTTWVWRATRSARSGEAVVAYRAAVRLKPADAGYRLNLGAALRRTGDVPGAVAALKDATRLAPARSRRLGRPRHGAVRPEEISTSAQAALDKATKLKPDFALAWNRLGRVELKRGQLPAAVAAQERARKLDGKSAAFAADLCRALLEQKDAARAAGECRAAVDLDPKSPLAHYELMKVLVAKGDCPDAESGAGQVQGAARGQARGTEAGRRHRRHLHRTRRALRWEARRDASGNRADRLAAREVVRLISRDAAGRSPSGSPDVRRRPAGAGV